MHGRLKVKSSEQQQAEKKAERATKVKQYNEAIKQVPIFYDHYYLIPMLLIVIITI